MRRDAEFFGEQELVLVHVARRLKEAVRLEKTLDAGSIDYLVEPTPYMAGILFRSERVGAFFYVALEVEDRARELIVRGGFKPWKR